MTKPNKVAENFYHFAKLALVPANIKSFLTSATEEQEIAFHKLHQKFVDICRKSKFKNERLLENRLHEYYPFVKCNGTWQVSIPKLYLYLINARGPIATFQDERMQAVFNAIQNSQKYYQEYQDVIKKVQPKNAADWEQYTKLETEAYERFTARQSSIFG